MLRSPPTPRLGTRLTCSRTQLPILLSATAALVVLAVMGAHMLLQPRDAGYTIVKEVHYEHFKAAMDDIVKNQTRLCAELAKLQVRTSDEGTGSHDLY